MRNELITFTNPKSPVSEMFRNLRTNIQFMSNSQKLQTILITSTLPGEGKSWTTANLAVTFAQDGKSVVIVDADLRKGRQFSIFNVLARPGLSNYLSGVVNDGEGYNVDDIRNFVRPTDVENLYVIPAGDVPPNPSELLGNQRMFKLLVDLKDQFDMILFDAPPALLVTDSTIMARIVDTTIIVVAHQETKKDNLSKVQKSIKNVGGNLAGVVINKIPTSVKRYQDSYYGEYYGNTQQLTKSKNINTDLYLRGKATILDDRYKKQNTSIKDNTKNNVEKSKSLNNIEFNIEKESYKKQKDGIDKLIDSKLKIDTSMNSKDSTISNLNATEEMLRRMNRYIEEQKKKMNK